MKKKKRGARKLSWRPDAGSESHRARGTARGHQEEGACLGPLEGEGLVRDFLTTWC
jgi:hypothetical protein